MVKEKKKYNYDKILEQILISDPKNVDAIIELSKMANKDGRSCLLDSKDILSSGKWDSDEKARLLHFFQKYSKDNRCFEDKKRNSIESFEYCLLYNFYDSFIAILKEIEMQKDEKIISEELANKWFKYAVYIISSSEMDFDLKKKYYNEVLNTLTEEEKRVLFKSDFSSHYILGTMNHSAFPNYLETKDLDLISKALKYVDNINYYWKNAIKTGDEELLQYMIDNGADVNYLPEDPALCLLTPLKYAINENNADIVEFLINNGARINDVIEEDFMEKIYSPRDNIRYSGNFRGYEKLLYDERTLNELKVLQFSRESSPINYAITLCPQFYYHNADSGIRIVYDGFDNRVVMRGSDYKEKDLASRTKIIMNIYSKIEDIEDKKNINYTDLLCFAFMTNENKFIKKLIKDAKEAGVIINVFKIVDYIIMLSEFISFDNKSNVNVLLDLLDECKDRLKDEKTGKLLSPSYYLLKKYIDDKTYSIYPTKINNLIKECIKNLTDEEKKLIPIANMVTDLKELKYLINNGFDINQKSADGDNLLLDIFWRGRFSHYNDELKDYVLDNANLGFKDKDGHNALYRGLLNLGSWDEFKCKYSSKFSCRSDYEKYVIKLINKMNLEDIQKTDIDQAIAYKNNVHVDGLSDGFVNPYYGSDRDNLEPDLCYHVHEELYLALANKGYKLPPKVVKTMLKKIGKHKEEWEKSKVDINGTRKFIFENLDSNTDIQDVDVEDQFKKVYKIISEEIKPNEPISDNAVDTIKECLKAFNEIIASLKSFYKNSIENKVDVEEYLNYALNNLGIDYRNLDDYFVKLFILILMRLNGRKPEILDELLSIASSFDINSIIADEKIEIDYEDLYDYAYGLDCYEENEVREDYIEPDFDLFDYYDSSMEFTGSIMQFAYLTNNLDAINVIAKHGGSYEFIVDGEDLTWQYVNSTKVRDMIYKATNKINIGELVDDDAQLFLSLTRKNK